MLSSFYESDMDKELDIGATDKDSKSQNIINSCRGGTAKDSITD
jgi:hypothetical protein